MKKLTVSIVLFLMVNCFPQADLTIDLVFQDNPFPPYGGSEIISFGLDSNATDGIDELLGESALPPDICPNLVGVFCATFIIPNGDYTLRDFRFGTLPFTGQIIHKIQCVAVDTSYVIIYNLPSGITANLTDLAGGIVFNETISGSGQIFIPNVGYGFLNKLWMYVNYNNVTPVELTSFSASILQNEKAVQLNWTTATETNNSGFAVERMPIENSKSKIQNSNWTEIGFVPGFGTTTEPKSYSFIEDLSLTPNLTHTLRYRLKQIDFDGTITYSNEVEVGVDFTPKEFVLYQNYPNPFNPKTVISYQSPVTGNVTLKVYDILGNEIATLVNEEKQPGVYEVEFDSHSDEGQNLPSGRQGLSSGIYFYQLKAESFNQTKKMILMK